MLLEKLLRDSENFSNDLDANTTQLLGASVARLAFEREDQDSVFFLFR